MPRQIPCAHFHCFFGTSLNCFQVAKCAYMLQFVQNAEFGSHIELITTIYDCVGSLQPFIEDE